MQNNGFYYGMFIMCIMFFHPIHAKLAISSLFLMFKDMKIIFMKVTYIKSTSQSKLCFLNIIGMYYT